MANGSSDFKNACYAALRNSTPEEQKAWIEAAIKSSRIALQASNLLDEELLILSEDIIKQKFRYQIGRRNLNLHITNSSHAMLDVLDGYVKDPDNQGGFASYLGIFDKEDSKAELSDIVLEVSRHSKDVKDVLAFLLVKTNTVQHVRSVLDDDMNKEVISLAKSNGSLTFESLKKRLGGQRALDSARKNLRLIFEHKSHNLSHR